MDNHNVVIKVHHRSSGRAVADYLHDKSHPNHKDTEIISPEGWRSALATSDCWSALDTTARQASKNGKVRSATEYEIPLPLELFSQAEDGTTTYNGDMIDYLVNGFLADYCEQSGIDRSHLVYDFVLHYNFGNNGKPDNPHLQGIIADRSVSYEEPKYETYKKDTYYDFVEKKKCKADSPNATLTHRAGDIKHDRHGNPILLEGGLTIEKTKNREITKREFLQGLKEGYCDRLNEIMPDRGIEWQVGSLDNMRIGQIRYTTKQARFQPEIVEGIKAVNEKIKDLNEVIEQADPEEIAPVVASIKACIKDTCKQVHSDPEEAKEDYRNLGETLEWELQQTRELLQREQDREEEREEQPELEHSLGGLFD